MSAIVFAMEGFSATISTVQLFAIFFHANAIFFSTCISFLTFVFFFSFTTNVNNNNNQTRWRLFEGIESFLFVLGRWRKILWFRIGFESIPKPTDSSTFGIVICKMSKDKKFGRWRQNFEWRSFGNSDEISQTEFDTSKKIYMEEWLIDSDKRNEMKFCWKYISIFFLDIILCWKKKRHEWKGKSKHTHKTNINKTKQNTGSHNSFDWNLLWSLEIA